MARNSSFPFTCLNKSDEPSPAGSEPRRHLSGRAERRQPVGRGPRPGTRPTHRAPADRGAGGGLGRRLFTRGPGGLPPTSEALRAGAEAMEAAAATFRRNAQADAGPVGGTVRVMASVVHATEVLPSLLAPLVAAHPGLTLEAVPEDRTSDLLRQDADMAVRFVAPAQAALVSRKAAPVPMGLFAAQAYLGPPRGARELGRVRASTPLWVTTGAGPSPTDSRSLGWGSPRDWLGAPTATSLNSQRFGRAWASASLRSAWASAWVSCAFCPPSARGRTRRA